MYSEDTGTGELFLECLSVKYVCDMEGKAFVNSEVQKVDCR